MVTSISATLTFLQQSHLSSGPVFSGKGAWLFFFLLSCPSSRILSGCNPEKKNPKTSLSFEKNNWICRSRILPGAVRQQNLWDRSPSAAPRLSRLGGTGAEIFFSSVLGVIQCVRDFKVNRAASKKNQSWTYITAMRTKMTESHVQNPRHESISKMNLRLIHVLYHWEGEVDGLCSIPPPGGDSEIQACFFDHVSCQSA